MKRSKLLMVKRKLGLLAALIVASLGVSAQNNGVDFDGVDDQINIGNTIYSNGVQTFTIECWIRPSNTAATGTGYHAIFGYQDLNSSLAVSRNPSLYMKGGNLHTDLNDGTTRYDFLTTNLRLLADKWVHVAWVKSGTTQTIFVNGHLLYSRSAPTNVRIYGNYQIGKVDNYWDGDIDEVRFWSTARTQEEIIANMNQPLVGSETGLEAYYNLNEGTGTTTENQATKNTANSYDGTLTNGPIWTTGLTALKAFNAVDVDGTDDALFARIKTINTSKFTIEANVYLKAYNGSRNQNIIGIFDDSTGSSQRISLFVNTSNKLSVFVQGGSGSATISGVQNFPTGKWLRVFLTYDLGSIKVYYIDQNSSNTFNGSLGFTGISLDGVDYLWAGSEFLPGISNVTPGGIRIDDIRVWSKALSTTEVTQFTDKIVPFGTSDVLAQYNLDIGSAGNSNASIAYFPCSFGNRYLTTYNLGMSGSASNLIAQDSSSWAVFNWIGGTNSVWTTASNWAEKIAPLAYSDIVIGANSSNVPALQAYTGVRSLNIASGKKLNINGKTLKIFQEYSGTGTLTGSTTSKLLFGNVTQNLTFYMDQTTDATTNALSEISLGHSGSVSMGNKVCLYQKLTHQYGDFNTNGNLVFKSNASGTAMAIIYDDARFSFLGNVVVESYFPAKRAFRLISSPVNSTGTIYANWQEGGSSSAGFGTHITGGGANGTDATASSNASMFTFSNANQNWAAVTSTNNATNDKITAGTPYRLLVRGDRTVSLSANAPTPNNTVLRASGALNLSDITTSVPSGTTANTDVLVGNPFQAPVDINEILSSSFFNVNMKTDVMYIWDPTINTRGAYVTVSLPNGTNSSNSAAGKYLMPGQSAFFKTRNNGSASVTMALTKIADVTRNQTFREGSTESELVIQLYQKDSFEMGSRVCDAAVVKFSDAYDSEYTIDDATKAFNLDENLGFKDAQGIWYSIDKRFLPSFDDTLILSLNKHRHSTYTLLFKGQNYEGLTPYLLDKYTQTYTAIDVINGTTYSFSVSDEASKQENRFRIVFNDLQNKEYVKPTALRVMPNPSNGTFQIELPQGTDIKDVRMTDILGREVSFNAKEIGKGQYQIESNSRIHEGLYWLNVSNYSIHLIVN